MPQSNTFIIPHAGGFIIYAPLAGRVVYMNADGAAQLQTYLKSGDPSNIDPTVAARLGGLQWLDAKPPPVPLPADRQFHPCTVTLFLTNRCNLRCSYCYAEAGESAPTTMPPRISGAAIDLVARNARRAGRPIHVGFHGGGEPTIAWDTLTETVEYAKTLAARQGNQPGFAIATNGVTSIEKAEFVAATFQQVTLSFDGPEDIQNKQRPSLDKSGSFASVMTFVDILRRHKTPLVIRSTITNENVARLSEMVVFFVQEVGCRQLRFEPVYMRGRCRRSPDNVPSPEVFAASFIAALDVAQKYGATLRYSAARLMGTFSSFCGCAQDAFNVTPDGDVTACFEVCDRGNPLSEEFFFGQYDTSEKRFKFDMARLARLRSLTVDNKPFCNTCYAKWNCAGDCPVKTPEPIVDFQTASPRCEMNQEITKALLIRALDTKACTSI